MLHAASPSNPQVSLGIFVNPPGNTRILTCSPGMQNAVTHADGSAKSSLDFVWQAPRDFQGEVLFRLDRLPSRSQFLTFKVCCCC